MVFFFTLAENLLNLKYTSIIDTLDIDITSLSKIDDAQIIRLQKQLKAYAVLNNESNIGELSQLVDGLKEENTRKGHIFIEQNLWLKQLLLSQYESIEIDSFKLNPSIDENDEALKTFIAPFLQEEIKPTLNFLFREERFNTLRKLLQQKALFTEEIKQQIITFFLSLIHI